ERQNGEVGQLPGQEPGGRRRSQPRCHRRPGVPRLQRAVTAAHRRRDGVHGPVLRGRGPEDRGHRAGGRCEGRRGREPLAGGRCRHRRDAHQGRLRRRPVGGGDPDRDRAGREVRGARPARLERAPVRRPDSRGAHRIALRRGGCVQRPRRDRAGHRHRAAGQLLRGAVGHLQRDPRRGPHLTRRARPALGHDRLAGRPAARPAHRHARRDAGAGRPQRRVHPADPRLQRAAARGPGPAGAHRLHPDDHPGPLASAAGSGRRQPRDAHPGAAAAVPGHRHPVPQPRGAGRDGEQAGTVRAAVHQRPGQRPLVRQLRERPAAHDRRLGRVQPGQRDAAHLVRHVLGRRGV
ncbi:MAG: MCE-family protein MceC, partial [uncultured Blastococcus sp.]